MKVKKELKWSVLLLLLLFPLLALVLLSNPDKKNQTQVVIEQSGDTSIIDIDSTIAPDEEPEPAPEMMPDGRFPQNYFQLPMHDDIYLAGTFGELRSNHFHTGVDIRTDGVEGKEVYAAAKGYVCRINVSQSGYGNALYISHPNGYTTVYAHLQHFSKDIQFYIRKHQYANQSFEVELYPEKGLIAVEQGDLIAYSGNTGGSGGPHLHFEIRKTNTSEPVNPLLFGINITDNLAPEILKLFIYQIDNQYREQEGTYPFINIRTNKNNLPSRNKTIKLPPGKYAVGAYMKDYFRSHNENLGINYSELFVNDQAVFECKIEKINFNTTRYINSHLDFCVHKTENIKAQKFFKDDGNKLDLYSYGKDKGTFLLTDTSKIKIVAHDLSGRKDSVLFTFIADSSTSFSPVEVQGNTKNATICKVFVPGQSFALSNNKVRLTLPSNALYFNYQVCVKEFTEHKGGYSPLWAIGELYVPIHFASNIAIKVEGEVKPEHRSKLLIVELDKGRKHPVGGSYNAGFIEASIRNFGSFYVGIDTIAPSISTIKFNPNHELIFSLGDNLSGVKTFNAYVDKQWILMEFEPKTGILKGKIPASFDKGKHVFTLKVKDERGNETTFEKSFTLP